MHAWPPIGPAKGTKQLVPLVMHQRVVHVCQSLGWATSGGTSTYFVGKVAVGGEKDLQFITPRLIHLPQLLNLVNLIQILGKLAHTEAINQWTVLN